MLCGVSVMRFICSLVVVLVYLLIGCGIARYVYKHERALLGPDPESVAARWVPFWGMYVVLWIITKLGKWIIFS